MPQKRKSNHEERQQHGKWPCHKLQAPIILSMAFAVFAIQSTSAQTNLANKPTIPVTFSSKKVTNEVKPSEYSSDAFLEFLLDKPRLEIEGNVISKFDRSLAVRITKQLGLKATSQVPCLSCAFGEACTNRTAIITGYPEFTAKKIGDRISIPVYLLEHKDSDKLCLLKCFYMAKPISPPPGILAQLQQEAFHGDVLCKSAGVLLIGKPIITCSAVSHLPGPCRLTGWCFCLESAEPEYETLQIGNNVVARGYITGTKVSGSNTWINVIYHNFSSGLGSALIDHNPEYTEQKIKRYLEGNGPWP